MRSISGSNWGASKASLLLIYRALIRSVIDYGAIAYDSASESLKHELDIIQNQALRIACGAMPSTPTNTLQIETGEKPLQLRRLEQQLKYGIKIKNSAHHPARPVIEEDWRIHYGKFKPGSEPLVTKITDFLRTHKTTDYEVPMLPEVPPWVTKRCMVDIQLSSLINKKQSDTILKANALHKIDTYGDHLHIYTDGSKTDTGIVGSSFCVPHLDIQESARLNDNVTVYAAELTAIQLAAEWVIRNEPVKNVNKIAIFSDSLASLLSVNAGRSRSRPNLLVHLIDTLHKIKSNVTLVWIPGHAGLK